MDVYPFKESRTDHYRNRDESARRYGEMYGPVRPSTARHGNRYAPYEHRKQQQLRQKHRENEVEWFNPQMPLTIETKSSHDPPVMVEEIAFEHRCDKASASQSSGNKLMFYF